MAEPNRRDIATEIARDKARRIGRGEFSDDDKPAAVPATGLLFAEVARRFVREHVHAPVYENGVKLSGMQDHAGVRSTIEKILIPRLGAVPVRDITFPDCEALRNERLAAPKLRGGKTIVETEGKRSIARVNREMSTLRMVFNFAVEIRAVDRNPMQAVGRRRSLVVSKAERARERVLTAEEERRMMDAYSAAGLDRSADFFVFALDTGMRSAEARGLELRDLDFAAGLCGIITVRWEVAKSKKKRVIPMSRRVRAILERRAARLTSPAAKLFDDLSETQVRDDFLRVKEIAGVADFQLRDARATLATRLLAQGMAQSDIARLTGHRFVERDNAAPVLQKHYLRLTDDTLTLAAQLITAQQDGEMVH